MQGKRIISLALIFVLLCVMFSAVPTSAFTNITSVSDTWMTLDAYGVDWRFDATKDGFDDYVHIDSRFAIRTNKAYDFNTTKLLINSLDIPSGYYTSIMITPDGKCQNTINPDVANGELCLKISKNASGELLLSRYENSVYNSIGVYAGADTYEFEFIVKANAKKTTTSMTTTQEYMFGVNGEYISSTDKTSWLYYFCSSDTFKKGYISIGTPNYFKANLKVCEKEPFVAANTNGLLYKPTLDSDGYQTLYAEEGKYAVATSASHDMFQETLTIKNISWNDSYDAAILLNFSSKYRFDETSVYTDGQSLGLIIQRDSSGSFLVYLYKKRTASSAQNKVELGRFKMTDTLNITFVSDGAGGYGVCFNGYYFENTLITTFLKNVQESSCYASVAATYSFECEAKFEKSDEAEWVSDNTTVKTSVDENGKTVYTATAGTSLTTAKKYNVLEKTVIMENPAFGDGERLVILSFSTTHIGNTRKDDAANGKLVFDIYTLNDASGNCSGFRVHTGMSTELPNGRDTSADTYYIGLCCVDGKYYLKINEKLYSSEKIDTFCESYAESAYISISTYNNQMKYSLDVWDKGPGYELNSSTYNVSEGILGSVEAYSCVNDALEKIDVTAGYELRVTTSAGKDRNFADLLATDDKLVVSYKDRDVGSFDIAVGGDITGDIDVLADDVVLLRKQLLGVGNLKGVFERATDVNNDGEINIVDVVSAKKRSIANFNSKRELLSLVDFTVEVEGGREPKILQLSDTLLIDSAQARETADLTDYQKNAWTSDKYEENCYSYVREAVESNAPDLIVITGNLVYGEFDDNGTAFQSFVDFMDSLGIPWAPVFGEHDNESAMGVDWQCDVLENAENCLFKQRTLTGNGNYSVGIMQNNKLLRIFYMLDTNGCVNASKKSLENNHTTRISGLGEDQQNWLKNSVSEVKTISSDTKISLAYGIPQEAFKTALSKYGFTNEDTRLNHINLNKTPECAPTDFGYIAEDINNSWDADNTLLSLMKQTGVDLVLSGGEAANSASVVMDGIRFQFGQKSSFYGRCNTVASDGVVTTLYPEDNDHTALIGATVMPLSFADGSIVQPYIYYCDTAGGDINWDKAVTLNVADFGAVGDGKTDDGNAVYDALEAFMKCGSGSKLVFENKTYYIADNSERHIRALNFKNMYNSTVEGNGATILIGGETVYMTVSDCVDFEIKDFDFDRSTRSHFVATVQKIVKNSSGTVEYIDIVSDRDFGFDGIYEPAGSVFGFTLKDGVVKRNYIYIDKLETLDAQSLKYRYYPDMDDSIHYTASNIKALSVGDSFVLPAPNIGHSMPDDFSIKGNAELTLKNINVLNSADFVFVVSNNEGKVTFDNVDIKAPAEETTRFVTWRDGFHCKGNKDSLIWKNCDAVGLGDDIINISANMLNVSEVIAADEIKCDYRVTGGGYYNVRAGDSVVIYDADTGKLIAETTVERVVNQRYNHYILSDSISNLTAGENIRLYFDNHAAPDSQLINCNFEGTMRFKGSGGRAENCKLSMYALVMYPEDYREGPIPHDITFSKCDFTGTSSGRIEISCLSPVETWESGYYRLENIRFENCTGLSKSLFKYKNNFVSGSVDYITVTPAI